MKDTIYKTYNLTGRTVRIRMKEGPYSHVPITEIKDLTMPVKITAEYPKFLCGIVQPHYNPVGMGPSKPYPITLDKFKLYSGAIELREGS